MAVYVSNLPMIWPLMREWFPALRGFTPGQKSSSQGNGGTYGTSSKAGMSRGISIPGRGFGGKRASDSAGGIVTTIRGKGESMEELSSGDEMELVGISRKDSWEGQRQVAGGEEWDGAFVKGGIHKSTTVQVSEEHIEPHGAPQKPKEAFLNEKDLENGIGGTGKKWDFGKGSESGRF